MKVENLSKQSLKTAMRSYVKNVGPKQLIELAASAIADSIPESDDMDPFEEDCFILASELFALLDETVLAPVKDHSETV